MLKNYFTLAFRNLLRNKTNSLINIGGLAVGLACVIFITLYVQDELRYDKGFKMSDRIYQVTLNANFGGQEFNTSNTPPPVSIDMHTTFPEVEDYTRVFRMGNIAIHNAEPALAGRPFTEKNLWAVDSNFLQVFDYPMIEGDPVSCLKKYHSIVITETMARKYFGARSPIGGSLVLDTYEAPFVVTGVLKDLPSNVSLQFDMLMPVRDCPPVQRFSWSWVWCQMTAYVTLTPQAAKDPSAVQKLEAKFPTMVRKDAARAFARIGQPFDEFVKKGGRWDFHLQRLSDVHLHSADMGTPYSNLGNVKYVYIFSFVALFVVLLACINFMNLSTARSERRAKEVGIRKAIGSLRGQLIGQFFCESILVAAFSFVLALALLLLVLPSFNGLAEKKMSIPWSNPVFWIAGILFSLFTGLIAGSYPALYLSSFQAVKVLKGTFRPGRSASLPRKILVVLQFTVSVVLIICTIIVFRQIKYAKDRPLGYDSDGLITTDLTPQISNHFYAIRNELKQSGVIDDMALSSNSTIDWNVDVTELYWKDKDPGLSIIFPFNNVSYEYGKTIGWQIVEGRDFSPEYPSDSSAFILNQAAVRIMGFQHPIGETIEWHGRPYKVIGVIRDIIFESPYRPVNPSIFNMTGNVSLVVTLRITRQMPPSKALDKISAVFNNYDPSVAFNFQFVDGQYAKRFDDEVRIGKLAGFFTILAIFISCLGLFGMASFMTERRVKEIGVRKVLGASLFSIWGLLSREFLLLVTIALLIAMPVAFLFMHGWLLNYAYHTSMSWWIFALAALGSLLITILTVSFQAIKAALANPVKSLRSE